ncbi:polyprenyl diphosphate synthase [Rhodopirellula sallentina]|uniref:Isoprenyl transferase n=1 Tax=Rhodopirellula sallentina SM41 TaxID=1263870 RepID=M5TRM6_9BACT|nr:polyprenyl diphosphate synthase [Rhodopirellula sallentina]EMI51810.1 Di-trans-poly-cis-decaprenylcistransferase-like protein [Rhodopirellula sallentina SM41]
MSTSRPSNSDNILNPETPSTSPAAADPTPEGNLPRHVAIIMDGNGRWAQGRGLPRIEGHRRGVATVRRTTEMASRLKLEALTLYCLSSENWKRPKTELDFLMHLLRQYLIEERRTLLEQNLRLRFIGRVDRLDEKVLREVERTQKLCRDNTGTELVLAVDYGGRDEIARATRRLVTKALEEGLSPDSIDEKLVAENLDTQGLAEVDLMIRTGGDMRISNFLLWQVSYAEFWFTQKCWPEFEDEDFQQALTDFGERTRRFGGLVPN